LNVLDMAKAILIHYNGDEAYPWEAKTGII
jgi:hypothetical protein